MGSYQENHQNIENAVQAKLGSLELRLREGNVESRLEAWGVYLEKNKGKRLQLKEHEGLYYLGKQARAAGLTDSQIDARIKLGRKEYLRPQPIEQKPRYDTVEDNIWKD